MRGGHFQFSHDGLVLLSFVETHGRLLLCVFRLLNVETEFLGSSICTVFLEFHRQIDGEFFEFLFDFCRSCIFFLTENGGVAADSLVLIVVETQICVFVLRFQFIVAVVIQIYKQLRDHSSGSFAINFIN